MSKDSFPTLPFGDSKTSYEVAEATFVPWYQKYNSLLQLSTKVEVGSASGILGKTEKSGDVYKGSCTW